MRSKRKILTSLGTFYTVVLILLILLICYVILFHPPRAEAIKTMEIEISETPGVYDGKVKIYRDANNVLVLEVDTVLFEIEDSDASIGGKMFYRIDGTDVAVPDGGTGKSSWTQYAIPFMDTTTSFDQVPIGTPGEVLSVNATTNGYQWTAKGSALHENVLIVAKSGGDYTTIQDAIDAAASGDVILIAPGTYDETINWTAKSDIHLVGISRDACIITRNFAQPGAASLGDGTFNWSNSNASIQNLTIRNTAAAPNATIALYLGSGTKYIRNCLFYGAGRDIVTCGSGTNYFNDCRIYNTAAGHVVWIYNGDNTFTNCEIECEGTVVQFSTLAYVKSGSFYNSSLKCTGAAGYVFDLVHGNNTLIVDNCLVQTGGGATLFYRTLGTIYLGRVVGQDNNAPTFTMLKNADSWFQSVSVGSVSPTASPGDVKISGSLRTGASSYFPVNTYFYFGASPVFGGTGARSEFYASGTENSSRFYGKSPYPLRATIDSSGLTMNSLPITLSGQKITAMIVDVEDYSGGKPAAAVAYRGQLVFEQGAIGVSDALYICIKNTGDGYQWKLIADETTP